MHSARQTRILSPISFPQCPVCLLALPLLCFGLLCAPAATQVQPPGAAHSIPPSDSKLIDIKVTGSKRFTQDEVAAAIGLPLGTTVSDEAFRKAARQLGETGAFNAISYTFT